MALTLFYFGAALFILVVFHEYGHFVVARLFKVKVLRFSVGFGKILTSWCSRSGTEYALSLIPLGGYIKMLDENEGVVAPEERHLAFNCKPLWVRSCIVFAGPLFNFIFAFFALWLILVIGVYSLAPIIQEVSPNTMAAEAGLVANEEIIAVNHKPIQSWRDFQYALMPFIGGEQALLLDLKSLATNRERQVTFPLTKLTLEGKKPDLLKDLGITPFIPRLPPIVHQIINDSPAQAAGFKTGDRILSINGKICADWMDLVTFVQKNPGEHIQLRIQRGQSELTIPVQIRAVQTQKGVSGFLGMQSQASNWPKEWLRYEHQQPFPALKTAFIQTMELTHATVALLGRFISGKLSSQSLSGPVGIAQSAGESGRGGLTAYLAFLAIVSISLGVLNLLPIPVLDGGHLLFYLIEGIIRRPLNEKIKLAGLYVGFVLLFSITLLAFSNDIWRLWS